jgi:iron complex outermembrane receptor protein
MSLRSVRFQVGARWEQGDTRAPGTTLPGRSFAGLSASGGLLWRPESAWDLGVEVSRSVRLPTAEELYANGPHLATFQFEIGDPGLIEEESLSLDVSIHRKGKRVTGGLDLFTNRFRGYIYLTPTGNTIQVDREEVPEYITLQKDATFLGAEGQIVVDLFRSHPHVLQLEVKADAVRAEIEESGEPLPKIPPPRAGIGIRCEGKRFWGRLEALGVGRQDRLATFETPTDAYIMVNLSGGVRFVKRGVVHEVMLVATNVGNQLARNHVSPLKDIVPYPGLDIGIGYKALF